MNEITFNIKDKKGNIVKTIKISVEMLDSSIPGEEVAIISQKIARELLKYVETELKKYKKSDEKEKIKDIGSGMFFRLIGLKRQYRVKTFTIGNNGIIDLLPL